MRSRGAIARVSPGLMSIAVGLALVASLLFYWTLLFAGSLNHHDWSSHHWNYFDWVRISLTRFHTLPLFMNDAWVTKNFLANAEAPSLGPLVWLLFFLPTGAYIKLLIVVFSAAGLLGTFLLLRDLGVSDAIAAVGAVLFAFNGFFVAHITVGHHWALGGLLLPGLLCLYRRAALGSTGALWGAAALNAFTILGGQHQPFLWQNLFLGAFAGLWSIERRSLFPLARLALVWLATLGLGAVKLLPLLTEFATYAGAPRDPSPGGLDPLALLASEHTPGLPLRLLPTSLAARGQGPAFAPPGFAFLHGSGWWEYAGYVGAIGLGWIAVGLSVGLLAARRAWPWLVLGGVFLLLCSGGPLAAWLDGLPFWRTQRSPSRFLLLALFALTIAGTLGVQRLWRDASRRAPRALTALALALALIVSLDLQLQSRPWQRAATGPALESRDHRPRPLRLGTPGRALAELVDFAPNRLVYRVDAPEGGRIVFPFRLREGSDEWRIDGLPTFSERGKLAVEFPPGERDVVMIYRPQLFHAGLALSALSLLFLVFSVSWRHRTSRR